MNQSIYLTEYLDRKKEMSEFTPGSIWRMWAEYIKIESITREYVRYYYVSKDKRISKTYAMIIQHMINFKKSGHLEFITK